MKNVPAKNVTIRFIMILSEHLVRCDTDAVDFKNPWYTSNQLLNFHNLYIFIGPRSDHSLHLSLTN